MNIIEHVYTIVCASMHTITQILVPMLQVNLKKFRTKNLNLEKEIIVRN